MTTEATTGQGAAQALRVLAGYDGSRVALAGLKDVRELRLVERARTVGQRGHGARGVSGREPGGAFRRRWSARRHGRAPSARVQHAASNRRRFSSEIAMPSTGFSMPSNSIESVPS